MFELHFHVIHSIVQLVQSVHARKAFEAVQLSGQLFWGSGGCAGGRKL